jgi:carbamoyl-phosphate synthase / aspartate carbamoyltransferase
MASLLLSDGTVLTGQSFGAPVDSDGEVVFTTGMVGYPESMTDPSYRGQILVMTFPLVGNYGVPSEERNSWGFSAHLESEAIQVAGLIVAQVSEEYSHHKAVSSLQHWMEHHGVPGITGIDTRLLTKKLREEGVMLGRITSSIPRPLPPPEEGGTEPGSPSPVERGSGGEGGGKQLITDIEDPNTRNLVAEVSIVEPVAYLPDGTSISWEDLQANRYPLPATRSVIAYDCGMKRNILRSFLKRGVTVVRVPWDFDLDSYTGTIDGVFISNGPGDPKMCTATVAQIRKAMERNIPTFGICLGNQLLALAAGADTYKLPYGHRGMNQPCVEVADGNWQLAIGSQAPKQAKSQKPQATSLPRCLITSQNHGFAVSDQLPDGWRVWFTNANDGSVEGIRHESGKFFSVQFHPEAAPGPEDANYLFDEFVERLGVSG